MGILRVHIDFDSDDRDASVARLDALGAMKVDGKEERGHWRTVMLDIEGTEFCVSG